MILVNIHMILPLLLLALFVHILCIGAFNKFLNELPQGPDNVTARPDIRIAISDVRAHVVQFLCANIIRGLAFTEIAQREKKNTCDGPVQPSLA